MNYYPNFATLLNHYLNQADGRSASWLARKLELHPSTVNKWLNGNSRPRTPEVVIRIADVLAVYNPVERQKLLHAAGYGYQMADVTPVDQRAPTSVTPIAPMAGSNNPLHNGVSGAAIATFQPRQPLLLVGLAGGLVLLYLFVSKHLPIRPSFPMPPAGAASRAEWG